MRILFSFLLLLMAVSFVDSRQNDQGEIQGGQLVDTSNDSPGSPYQNLNYVARYDTGNQQ